MAMNSMDDIIALTTRALQEGRTVLYPTDTIWGVGCDAASAAAIDRLYLLKERDSSKSMLVLIGQTLCQHLLQGGLPQPLQATLTALLLASPRPTTVIVPAGLGLVEALLEGHLIADNLLAADGSLGLRVPQHAFCQQLLTRLDRPIVSSSANFSGQPSPTCYEEITAELKGRLDYCVPNLPALQSHRQQGSRILKLSPAGDIITIRD